MMFLGNEEYYKRRESTKLVAQPLGQTYSSSLQLQNNTTQSSVTPLAREPIQDVRFSDGSYSSYGIDINPFGFAYRADSMAEFGRDALYVAIELGSLAIPGGTLLGRGVRLAKRGFDLVD